MNGLFLVWVGLMALAVGLVGFATWHVRDCQRLAEELRKKHDAMDDALKCEWQQLTETNRAQMRRLHPEISAFLDGRVH